VFFWQPDCSAGAVGWILVHWFFWFYVIFECFQKILESVSKKIRNLNTSGFMSQKYSEDGVLSFSKAGNIIFTNAQIAGRRSGFPGEKERSAFIVQNAAPIL